MSSAPTHLALVTGAGKRLGRAIALRLAGEGCDVAVHFNTSSAEANAVVAEIRAAGRQAHAIGFDLSDPAALETGFAALISAFGRAPDVLVNCASMFEWDDIASVTPDSLHRHYATNTVAPVLLARLVANAASADTRGLILNITDHKLAATHGDHLAYSLTKYALDGFTQMMARALAPRFRVCAIAPGHTLPGPGETQAHFDAVHDQTPLGYGPTTDDIAATAAFLLKSPAITGQTLIVDGGGFMASAARDISFR